MRHPAERFDGVRAVARRSFEFTTGRTRARECPRVALRSRQNAMRVSATRPPAAQLSSDTPK